MPQKGSSKKCQSIAHTEIVLVYRYNERIQSFLQQQHQSQLKRNESD